MRIQSISLVSFSANNKKDIKTSPAVRSSKPINREYNKKYDILVALSRSKAKRKSDEINNYLKDCMEEVKDIKKSARSHERQCMEILFKSSVFKQKCTIQNRDYNVTFDEINEETKLPSAFNLWRNGKFIRQYTINSKDPLSIDVFDCEDKTMVEEFSIKGKELENYTLTNQKTKEAELITINDDGFYITEGKITPHGTCINENTTITKTKELTYDPSGYSYYSEHKNGEKKSYILENKNWKRIYK